MASYIARRVLQVIPTLWVLLTIIFILLNILPGDAALLAGDPRMAKNPQVMARIRAKWGLNDPFYVRYFKYFGNLLQGDLGISYRTSEKVSTLLGSALLASLKLVGLASAGAMVLGIMLGFISGIRHGSFIDLCSMGFAILGISAPRFWVGLMLMYFFAVILGILPASGYGSNIKYYILPSITLGIPMIALLARTTRSAVLDVRQEDYVRTARSKGLSEYLVRSKHIFRNAFLPVMTIAGLQIGTLLANTVIVEKIFSWPGLGNLIVTSIMRRDIPTIQGCVLVFCLGFILINTLIDILYAYLDPRIKYD